MGLLSNDRVQPLTLIIYKIIDLLNKFVEDSKVEGEFSIIINSESDSDSSLNEETPSDLDSSDLGLSDLGLSDLSPSDLGPSDSSVSKEGSTCPLSKSILRLHFHSVRTQMLALTRKRDSVLIYFIT
jgi:hypothetical protein